MYNIIASLYVAVLFFILTPGVALNIPGKNLIITALVHSALFAVVFGLTHKLVWNLSRTFVTEPFLQSYGITKSTQLIGKKCSMNSDCPPGTGCWDDEEGKPGVKSNYICK